MTAQEKVAPLPAGAHVATFTDPELYALATVALAPGAAAPRILGTARDRFHGKIMRANLGRLNVGLGGASLPIGFTCGVPNAHVFAFATEGESERRISGWTIGGNDIFHHRPNEQAYSTPTSHFGQPSPYAVIVAPFDLLAEQGPDVFSVAPGVPLNDNRLFQAPKDALVRLVGLMNDAARIAEQSPWITAAPGPAKALAGTIMEALLACVIRGGAKRDRAALRRHRRIVGKLEAALQERPETMLSLPDLCAEVGVAKRTLNLACLEFLGQGPMQYARMRRLDHVRETLLTSDPDATQVTGVAMHFGFWELGRFAQVYRHRFGERPSDTLRGNKIRGK